MDYKNLYLQHYNSTLQEKESWVKDLLNEFKKQKRTHSYSIRAAKNRLHPRIEKSKIESNYPISEKKIDQLFRRRDELYSENSLEFILENEIKKSFRYVRGEFSDFIKQLAHFIAIEDAYINFDAQYQLNELFFEFDELDRISLFPKEGDIEQHKDYIRLIKKRAPENEKPETEEFIALQKKKEKKSERLLPDLSENEKILLIHYLIRSKSLEKIERVKILALLGDSPISTDIFKQESRDNIQYQEILKGYQYRGIKKAKETLTSLFDQVEVFKIVNLNRAIKMDLNAIKKEKIKKTLNQN